MRMVVFRGEKCLRRRLTCRGLSVKLRHVCMSSSDSWMHMDLGKDVLVCSSQRSGIDAVHVSSMKSSMKFEFYLSMLSIYSYLRWQWMIG